MKVTDHIRFEVDVIFGHAFSSPSFPAFMYAPATLCPERCSDINILAVHQLLQRN